MIPGVPGKAARAFAGPIRNNPEHTNSLWRFTYLEHGIHLIAKK